MSANYLPNLNTYTDLKPFRFWCQKVLPLAYDDSLSYYELLNKVVDYLNKTMEDVTLSIEDVQKLHTAYEQLETYVNDYFDNLDVQEEINTKLDSLVEDGTIHDIFNPDVEAILSVANQAASDAIEAIPSNVTAWLDTHVTPETEILLDESLTIDGAAADAKAAGDQIRALKSDLNIVIDGDYKLTPTWVYGAVTANGELTDTGTPTPLIRTDKINLLPGAKLSISFDGTYALRIAEYDQSGLFVKLTTASYITSDTDVTIENPIVAFGLGTDLSNPIWLDDAAGASIVWANADENKLNAVLTDYAKYSTGKNLFNKAVFVEGYMGTNVGGISANPAYRTSDWIPVASGQTVVISPRVRDFLFYDSDIVPVTSSYVNVATNNYTYTATEDGFVRFTYYKEDEDGVQCEFGSTPTAYEPFSYKLSDLLELSIRQKAQINDLIEGGSLDGVTLVSFGDSIMAGDGNSGTGIVDLLTSLHGATGTDYAVGGASMQKITGLNCIPEQIQSAITNGLTAPSLFLLDGLSNDAAANDSTLGTLGESFDYATAGYTDSYVEGMEYAIGLLKTNFPGVPILYMIPHATPSRTWARETTYGAMARNICKKWSIPIADIYSGGNLNARIDAQKALYCDAGGTHPNNDGYVKFYIPTIFSRIKEILS